eukprot:528128_1
MSPMPREDIRTRALRILVAQASSWPRWARRWEVNQSSGGVVGAAARRGEGLSPLLSGGGFFGGLSYRGNCEGVMECRDVEGDSSNFRTGSGSATGNLGGITLPMSDSVKVRSQWWEIADPEASSGVGSDNNNKNKQKMKKQNKPKNKNNGEIELRREFAEKKEGKHEPTSVSTPAALEKVGQDTAVIGSQIAPEQLRGGEGGGFNVYPGYCHTLR